MSMRPVPAALRRSVFLVVLLVMPLVLEATEPETAATPDLVTLELLLPGGDPVTVTVVEGQLATFADHERDYRIGIIPRVLDKASGYVELELLEFTGRGSAPQIGKRLEFLRGQVGFRSVTAATGGMPLDILVVAAAPANEFSPPVCSTSTYQLSFGQEQNGDGCCVTCGGLETCGCSVSTSCGTCSSC